MALTTENTKWQIIAKFGLINALLLIALNLVLYITNAQTSLGYLNSILVFMIVISTSYFGVIACRNEYYNGFLTYGQGVGAGFFINALACFLLSFYTYIFVVFIDPDYLNNILSQSKKMMIERGDSEEIIATSMGWVKKFTTPFYFSLFAGLGNLFSSFIGVLLLSIFTRKEDPNSHYNSLNN